MKTISKKPIHSLICAASLFLLGSSFSYASESSMEDLHTEYSDSKAFTMKDSKSIKSNTPDETIGHGPVSSQKGDDIDNAGFVVMPKKSSIFSSFFMYDPHGMPRKQTPLLFPVDIRKMLMDSSPEALKPSKEPLVSAFGDSMLSFIESRKKDIPDAVVTSLAQPQSNQDDDSIGEASTKGNSPAVSRQIQALSGYISSKYSVYSEDAKVIVSKAFDYAKEHDLDPYVILGIIKVESTFKKTAINRLYNTTGLMQVHPAAHQEKINSIGGYAQLKNIAPNMKVGTRILADCLDKYGNVMTGLQCYNGAVRDKSMKYAKKVMNARAGFISVGY